MSYKNLHTISTKKSFFSIFTQKVSRRDKSLCGLYIEIRNEHMVIFDQFNKGIVPKIEILLNFGHPLGKVVLPGGPVFYEV